MLVRENITSNFKRGQEPRDAMELGDPLMRKVPEFLKQAREDLSKMNLEDFDYIKNNILHYLFMNWLRQLGIEKNEEGYFEIGEDNVMLFLSYGGVSNLKIKVNVFRKTSDFVDQTLTFDSFADLKTWIENKTKLDVS